MGREPGKEAVTLSLFSSGKWEAMGGLGSWASPRSCAVIFQLLGYLCEKFWFKSSKAEVTEAQPRGKAQPWAAQGGVGQRKPPRPFPRETPPLPARTRMTRR